MTPPTSPPPPPSQDQLAQSLLAARAALAQLRATLAWTAQAVGRPS